MAMSQHDVTAEPWIIIAPLIPTQKSVPGCEQHDDRRTLHGMFFVLKTGCTWEDVPGV
jgi:transposase